MSDIMGIIATVEDDKDFNQKDYKKVTLVDGKELKVKYGRGGALKAKWGLLQEGVAMKFTMTDFTKQDGVKIPFVSDIATVEGELKPPQSDKAVLPEHQKEIDKAQEPPPIDFDKVKDRDGMPLSVKIRTFCISYAKDIGVGKMQKGEDMSVMTIMGIATMLEKWVITGTYKE